MAKIVAQTNTHFKLYKELHKPYLSNEQLFVFLPADGTGGTPSQPPPSPPPPEMSGHHVHFNRVPQVHYYYTDGHYDHDDDSVPQVQYYYVDEDDDDDDDYDYENGQDNY